MADKLRIVNRALQRIGAKRLSTLTDNTRERLAVDAAYADIVAQELSENFWTFATKRVEITADPSIFASSAEIAAAGSGYVVGETLTLVGGTGTAAIFEVDEIDGSGGVTAVSVGAQRGDYSVAPTSPVSTTASASGTGCTLTLTTETGPRFGRFYTYAQPSDFLRLAPKDPHQAARFRELLFELDSGGKKIVNNTGGELQLRYISDLSVLPNGITNMEDLFHPLFANAISMRLGMELAEELTGSDRKLKNLERMYNHFVKTARRIDAIEQGPIEPEVDEFVSVRQSEFDNDPTLRPYA